MTISKDIIEAVQNAILEGKTEVETHGLIFYMDYEVQEWSNNERDPTLQAGWCKYSISNIYVCVKVEGGQVQIGAFDSEEFVLQSNLSGEY